MDICRDALCAPCELKMTKNTALLGRSFRPASAGFTVVELIVLVAIISVLSAIGFPLYLSYSRAQETDGGRGPSWFR